jgi:hypothetical protein
VEVTIERSVAPDRIDHFYRFYRAAFEPLRPRAAARHVFTRDEFAAEMRDERIDKYVAWDSGAAVGLTTLTDDLDSLPWIEPAFYLERHPRQAARRAVYYLGYTLVDPDPRAHTFQAFRSMAHALLERVAAQHGVLAYDVSGYNTEGQVGRMITSLLRRFGARVEAADTQVFYTAEFGPADA